MRDVDSTLDPVMERWAVSFLGLPSQRTMTGGGVGGLEERTCIVFSFWRPEVQVRTLQGGFLPGLFPTSGGSKQP